MCARKAGRGAYPRLQLNHRRQACPSNPRAEAYRIRAAAYSEKANHKLAIADFTEAINLKGDDATSYFGRGQSQLAEETLRGPLPT